MAKTKKLTRRQKEALGMKPPKLSKYQLKRGRDGGADTKLAAELTKWGQANG